MAERPSLAQKVLSAITGLTPATRTESGFSKATGGAESVDPRERRQFRRIEAQVYCRPAGLKMFSKHEEPIDVSRGGVRVFSDDPLAVGERLTLELFVKGNPGKSVTFDAEVAWTEALPAGAPGMFDVGLKFLHVSPENEALLAQVLETK